MDPNNYIGERVRDAYLVAKGAAARGAEAAAKGKSWKEIGKGAGAGAVEGALEVWQEHTGNSIGQAAIAGGKQVITSALDGDSPKDIVKKTKEAATKQYINSILGKVVDEAGGALVADKVDKLKNLGVPEGAAESLVKPFKDKATAVGAFTKEVFGGPATDVLYGDDEKKSIEESAKDLGNRTDNG